LAALALCLLAAQMLGQWHHLLHGPGSAAAVQAGLHAQGPTQAQPQRADGGAGGSTEVREAHPFGHGGGDAGCRLYDQLIQPACPAGALPAVLPAAVCCQVLRGYAGAALARWAALFDARGPPAQA